MSISRPRYAIHGLVTCVLCGTQLGCGAETPPARATPPTESLSAFCTRVEPELRTLRQLHGTAVLRLRELATLDRDALRQTRSRQLKASGRARLVKALELELQRVRLAVRAAEQAGATESMRAIAVAIRSSERASRGAQRLVRQLCAHDNHNPRLG